MNAGFKSMENIEDKYDEEIKINLKIKKLYKLAEEHSEHIIAMMNKYDDYVNGYTYRDNEEAYKIINVLDKHVDGIYEHIGFLQQKLRKIIYGNSQCNCYECINGRVKK